jgi:hypothetical protein
MREIFDFLFNQLTPEMALAGGVPFPPVKHDQKPDLLVAKGAGIFNPFNVMGGFKGATLNPFQSQKKSSGGNGSLMPPPAPEAAALPPPPPPPPPPPSPTQTAQDVSQAGYDAQKAQQSKFGFRASLLQPMGNPATGSKSLLGN